MPKSAPYRYLFVPMNNGPHTKHMHIGEIIKLFREEHHLSQEQFAALVRCWIVHEFPGDPNILNKFSLSQSAVSHYESKKYCPKIDMLTAISRVMGYDTSISGYEFMTGYSRVAKTEEGFKFVVPRTRKQTVKASAPAIVKAALDNPKMLENRRYTDPHMPWTGLYMN